MCSLSPVSPPLRRKAVCKQTDSFFQFLFPAMVFILIVFRCGIFVSGDQLKRPFGVVLVATWFLGDNLELRSFD